MSSGGTGRRKAKWARRKPSSLGCRRRAALGGEGARAKLLPGSAFMCFRSPKHLCFLIRTMITIQLVAFAERCEVGLVKGMKHFGIHRQKDFYGN